ncbi:MAG: L,D-transpeptidase [Paludibaculum sp.]
MQQQSKKQVAAKVQADQGAARHRRGARHRHRRYEQQVPLLRRRQQPGDALRHRRRPRRFRLVRRGEDRPQGGMAELDAAGRDARREAKKGRILPVVQEGGEDNPLGARAMYLYKGGRDTIFRIHGTNQPWTIGLNMSSGCIRMMNKDVEHLYDRADIGTKVIVVGPGNKQGEVAFEDRGIDILRTIFGG